MWRVKYGHTCMPMVNIFSERTNERMQWRRPPQLWCPCASNNGDRTRGPPADRTFKIGGRAAGGTLNLLLYQYYARRLAWMCVCVYGLRTRRFRRSYFSVACMAVFAYWWHRRVRTERDASELFRRFWCARSVHKTWMTDKCISNSVTYKNTL